MSVEEPHHERFANEFGAAPVLHVDIRRFTDNFDTVGASVMRPWEYVVLTGEGDVFYARVVSLRNKSSTKPVPRRDACSTPATTCWCMTPTPRR